MRKYLWLLLIPAVAVASSIKVWSSPETIRASDLNTVLAHLHANLGHGHGAVITNSDVSASAAIAHSKLATPALVTKGWATLDSVCNGAAASGTTCTGTITKAGVVADVQSGGATGTYIVTFSPALSDAKYVSLITADTVVMCRYLNKLTTSVAVYCETAGAVATNVKFDILIMDN